MAETKVDPKILAKQAELDKQKAAAAQAEAEYNEMIKKADEQRAKDLAKVNSDISDTDKKKALGSFPEIIKKLESEVAISISVSGKRYIQNHNKTDLEILGLQLGVLKSLKELTK